MASDRSLVTWTAESSQSVSDRLESGRRCLWVLHSPDMSLRDRRLVLADSVLLGRERDDVRDSIVLRDKRVSRRHAIIRRRGSSPLYELRDQGSRNGTTVNGRNVRHIGLANGDIIRVGDTLFELGPMDLPDDLLDPTVVGSSAALRRVLTDIKRAADSDLPVLLLGESGAGKSLLARVLHERGDRSGPFVPINCGAIPGELAESYLFGHKRGAFTGATADAVGVFEKANGGTLFLDEIGSLPLAQQPKLLRVLESHEFSPVGQAGVCQTDARVVAATNSDLIRAVGQGSFRHDLYTRLAGFIVRVPPLRERRADIPRLVEHFASSRLAWSADALERMLVYHWPGNVRELRFLIERLMLLDERSNRVGTEHLARLSPELARATSARSSETPKTAAVPVGPTGGAGATPANTHPAQRPDKADLEATLTLYMGNVMRVATFYGKDPKQVYRWMKAYDIDPAPYRSRR